MIQRQRCGSIHWLDAAIHRTATPPSMRSCFHGGMRAAHWELKSRTMLRALVALCTLNVQAVTATERVGHGAVGDSTEQDRKHDDPGNRFTMQDTKLLETNEDE